MDGNPFTEQNLVERRTLLRFLEVKVFKEKVLSTLFSITIKAKDLFANSGLST